MRSRRDNERKSAHTSREKLDEVSRVLGVVSRITKERKMFRKNDENYQQTKSQFST